MLTKTLSKKLSCHWIRMLVAFFFICFLSIPVYGFKLTPMEIQLDPSGRGASGLFRVENDSDQDVAVQITMAKREVSLEGKEQNPAAEDDFTIFPALVTLGPKKTQAVRVRWIGNSKPEKELAYRIIAEQLPVNLVGGSGGANVKLIVRYIGSVYIVPRGVKPDIVLDTVSQETGPDGERKIAITFFNRGSAHGFLTNLRLHITSDGKAVYPVGINSNTQETEKTISTSDSTSTNKHPNFVKPGDKEQVSLTEDLLKGITGENILAGNKRRFLMPWPKELKPGTIQAKFEIDLP